MKAPKIAPLNAKRMEDFIFLYLQISPSVCENAFNSHYGHDGPHYYKELLKVLSKRKLLSSLPEPAMAIEEKIAC